MIRPVFVVASVLAAAMAACRGDPDETSGGSEVAAVEEPESHPEPHSEAETRPSLAAYGTPSIEGAEVTRQGRRIRIRLEWGKVEGAARYRVQVAKTLTFSRPVVDQVTPKLRVTPGRLEPAIYFWRVCAIGDVGEGAFTGVQVLDATQTGHRDSRARRRIERRAANGEPAAAATAPVKAGRRTPTLRLAWRHPEQRSVVTTNPIQVTGVATRGTMVRLNDAEPIEVVSKFAISVRLRHGRNDLVLVAELGDQSKTLRRSIWYADPAKLAPVRERFEALRAQLDEIGAIRDELEETFRTLESRIAEAKSAAAMDELVSEMNRIKEIRRDIDTEINAAISELDQLLGS